MSHLYTKHSVSTTTFLLMHKKEISLRYIRRPQILEHVVSEVKGASLS